MNYHLGTNRSTRQSKKKKFLWLIIIILVLFFYSEIISVFGGVFRTLVYPIWKAETKLDEQTINPFGFLLSKKKLLIANEQLQKDRNEAEMMLADRNLLLKENLELKEIMGRLTVNEMILASVLAKPDTSLYDSLIVDVGKDSGIKIGDRVFAFGNILVGEIEEINRDSSKVKLYSSPGEEVSVLVGLYNIEATATGSGAGNFEIKLPRGVEVEIGDPVFLAGTDAKVLGNIGEIIASPIDSFQTLVFKSPVNIFELKWVQVLKSE